MTKPSIIVSTWQGGLLAINGDGRCTQEIAEPIVRGLAPDGRDGGALAIAGRHSLLRRSSLKNGVGEWTTIATSEFELSCCMAVHGEIYVGTDDARMLRLRSGDGRGVLEPLEGFNAVAGRDAWFAGSAIVNGQRVGPPLGVRSVGANSDGSILFANVHVGGIPRSLDGGKTWQPTIDIHSDVHEVRAHPTHPEIVAAASAVGLCLSRDCGETWSVENEGLHATHCSVVAFSGDDILVSAATDPFTRQGRIYRRPLGTEGGCRLSAVEGGGMLEWTSGAPDTGCIASSGPYVAAADRGGNLYFSDDFAQTWTCLATGLPAPSGVLLYY